MKKIVLIITCLCTFLCTQYPSVLYGKQNPLPSPVTSEIEEKPYQDKDEHDTDALIQPDEDISQGEHDEKNCEACNEYWNTPWRLPDITIKLMKRRSLKILIFISLCYLYLKRHEIKTLYKKR